MLQDGKYDRGQARATGCLTIPKLSPVAESVGRAGPRRRRPATHVVRRSDRPGVRGATPRGNAPRRERRWAPSSHPLTCRVTAMRSGCGTPIRDSPSTLRRYSSGPRSNIGQHSSSGPRSRATASRNSGNRTTPTRNTRSSSRTAPSAHALLIVSVRRVPHLSPPRLTNNSRRAARVRSTAGLAQAGGRRPVAGGHQCSSGEAIGRVPPACCSSCPRRPACSCSPRCRRCRSRTSSPSCRCSP